MNISYFSAYRAHSVRCYTDFEKEESISFYDYVYFLSFLFFKSIGRLRYEIRTIFKFVRFNNIFHLFIVSYFHLRCTMFGTFVRYVRRYTYMRVKRSMSDRARYMIYYALWHAYATTV